MPVNLDSIARKEVFLLCLRVLQLLLKIEKLKPPKVGSHISKNVNSNMSLIDLYVTCHSKKLNDRTDFPCPLSLQVAFQCRTWILMKDNELVVHLIRLQT